MARRRDEMNPKTFNIMHGVVQGNNLLFTAIAGARIDFADRERSSQDPQDCFPCFLPSTPTSVCIFGCRSIRRQFLGPARRSSPWVHVGDFRFAERFFAGTSRTT